MNVVGIDCEQALDEPMARAAVQTLVRAYPGHDWYVLIRGGVMHIKAMNIHPQWGMCLHYSQIKGDATARQRSIVRSAGEFLERAGLRRGAWAELKVESVDGVPEKDMARAR